MRAFFLTVVFLSLTGCYGVREKVVERTETQSVDLDKFEMARVELSLGAGELRLQGGTPKLMEGTFRYHGSRKPEIAYRPNSFRSRLTIQSDRGENKSVSMGGFGERWDIRLNEDAPMDIDIKLGAGESRLDLGGFNIRDLDVSLGAGSVRLDLRGPKPKRNMNVRIRGGVGEAKIWLPTDAGVRADVHGGIGSINVTGLKKRGSSWENEQYQSAPVTVNLDVNGGIGSITVYGQ